MGALSAAVFCQKDAKRHLVKRLKAKQELQDLGRGLEMKNGLLSAAIERCESRLFTKEEILESDLRVIVRRASGKPA